MPIIKSLGWQSLGVSPIPSFSSLSYSCWVPHYDDTGVALHGVSASGTYYIGYLDTIGLKWETQYTTGSGAAVSPETFPPYYPSSGNIVNKQGTQPSYVWSLEGGSGNGSNANVWSTPAPGSSSFGEGIKARLIPYGINGTLIDDPNSPENLVWSLSLLFEASPNITKALLAFRSRSSSGSPTSDYTLLVEYDPLTDMVGNILGIGPSNIWPVKQRYCCPQRAQAWLGIGQNQFPFLVLDYNTGNAYDSRLLVSNGNPILSGTLFTTTSDVAPFGGITRFNSFANMESIQFQQFQYTSFDSNILTLPNPNGIVGENFLNLSITSGKLFYFDRNRKFLFSIVEPLPPGSGSVTNMNVGTNAFAIDTVTSEVWVLSIQAEEIEAFDVINMKRQRSE